MSCIISFFNFLHEFNFSPITFLSDCMNYQTTYEILKVIITIFIGLIKILYFIIMIKHYIIIGQFFFQ